MKDKMKIKGYNLNNYPLLLGEGKGEGLVN